MTYCWLLTQNCSQCRQIQPSWGFHKRQTVIILTVFNFISALLFTKSACFRKKKTKQNLCLRYQKKNSSINRNFSPFWSIIHHRDHVEHWLCVLKPNQKKNKSFKTKIKHRQITASHHGLTQLFGRAFNELSADWNRTKFATKKTPKSGVDYCSKGHACHTNATCLNLNTKYTCTCRSGFHGDGYECSGKFCLVSSNAFFNLQ